MGKGKRFEKNSIDKQDIPKRSAKKKNNAKKLNINYLFIVFFLILLLFSGWQIVTWYFGTKRDETEYQKLINEVIKDNLNVVEAEEITSEPEEISINFEKLLNINKDVVGWITINDTNINYPILKSYDNDYYLRRDINKNTSKSGSIFLDYRNNDFKDKNTVLYGHNMKNGTMFSQLKRIYNNELKKETKINIYTPNENMVYKIFSVYALKPEAFDMNTKISEMKKMSKINFNVDVGENDKVLTLFTCTDSMLERIIVHAVVEK